MTKSILKEKSFKFAARAVKFYKYMREKKKEYILSKQVLRSGTSIGAMIREAEYSESKIDFVHKLAVAQKETNETMYWLELLEATDYISKKDFENIYADATEILKIITSSINTVKSKLPKK